MTQSDFIVKFFDRIAPHQQAGERPAGSVRPLTPKGHQFVRKQTHNLVAPTGDTIADSWTDHFTVGAFCAEAIEAGLSFAVIQS